MLKDLRPGAASGGKTEREAAAVTPPQDPQKTKTEAQSGQLRGGNFILNYVGALTRKTGRAYSLRLLKEEQAGRAEERVKREKERQSEDEIMRRLNRAERTPGGFSTGRFVKLTRRKTVKPNGRGGWVKCTVIEPAKPPTPNLPALRVSLLDLPPLNLNAKQRKYEADVVTYDDLKQTTSDTVKSKNPSKRFRYVLFNDLWLAKNGFYYHLVPFILSVIFLAINLKYVNVGVNIGVACYLLLATFLCKKTWQDKAKFAPVRVLLIGLIILLFIVGAYLVERFLPQVYEKIYLPFSLKLFVLVFAVIRFGKFFVYFMIMYRQDASSDFGNVVKVKYGAPGSGKTSQSVQESLGLANQKWRDLQMQYYFLHSREKDILRRNNPDELLDYYDVKQSYEFYVKSRCIPCLWSNIEITDPAGRKCHRLEKEHLQGLKRLPSHCVIMTDEVGVMLKSDMSFNKAANYDLSDMFRLGRHFLNWSMICSEQDPNNIFIDARRVVGLNEGISGQTWICRPWLLEKIYGFLSFFKSDSFDKKIKREPKRAKFMAAFGGFISSIGFRLQPTVTSANTQTGIKGDTQDGSGAAVVRRQNRIIAATISDCYDERDYRRQYPSRYDREIKGDLEGSGTLGERVTGYGRQFVSTTPSLMEKRVAQDRKIKKLS